MTAKADIDALIARADAEYATTTSKVAQAENLGIQALSGLGVLAGWIDGLAERIDGLDPNRVGDSASLAAELAELRDQIVALAATIIE
jgi:hypothetical protein